eukprot:TRINITY_DN31590_c0_g1_i1.p1 TRINITY_DN31590_c0_g1~~TRINITY_DN31590_c0_g1_i1.p1  ORF type:complete len:557 (-),score=58.14 TRINITY_DN31590_c0_g1_i1:128-1798(-)
MACLSMWCRIALLISLGVVQSGCVVSIYGDGADFMSSCKDALDSCVREVEKPSLKSTAKLLSSAASIGAVLIPPPPGLVVGGGLLVAGSLLASFGSSRPKEPSVADAIEIMNRNFEMVELRMDSLRASVEQLQLTMRQVLGDVTTLYDDLHLGVATLRKINGVYLEFMGRVFDAQEDAQLASALRLYAIQQSQWLADEVYGVFDPINVEAYLRRLVAEAQFVNPPNDRTLDVGMVTLAYQQMLSTRFKLFTIMFSASMWEFMRATPETTRRLSELHHQIQSYQSIVARLGLPVNYSSAYLLSSHKKCRVAKLAGKYAPSDALNCCCSLNCSQGVVCPCSEDVVAGEPASVACGVRATTTTTTSFLCEADTQGTCHLLKCSNTRGAVNCVNGHCMCSSGYCSVDGACSPEWAQCRTTYTGGTCTLNNCDASRGAAECRRGFFRSFCMCVDGYCAVNGTCVPSHSRAVVGATPAQLIFEGDMWSTSSNVEFFALRRNASTAQQLVDYWALQLLSWKKLREANAFGCFGASVVFVVLFFRLYNARWRTSVDRGLRESLL